MPTVGVKVTGLKELIKRNEERIKAETWAGVMSKAMAEAELLAKQLCPVSKGVGAGKLRDSIKATLTGNFSYEMTATARNEKGVGYASFNEWGWYGIPAVGSVESPVFYLGGYRPFIRPAMWIANKKYQEYIKNIIFKGHYY